MSDIPYILTRLRDLAADLNRAASVTHLGQYWDGVRNTSRANAKRIHDLILDLEHR